MIDLIGKELVVHGGIGVLCLVQMYVIIRLYRDLMALEERYKEKTEKQVEKYHELADSMVAFLTSVEKRRLNKGGRYGEST